MLNFNSSAIQKAIKNKTSTNVPALVVRLFSKDINSEIETLRKRLKNKDEATLIPGVYMMQKDGESGSHFMMQSCAISRNDASVIPQSDYSDYESINAEWVVVSGSTYQEALPVINPNFGSISNVSLIVSEANAFVTVTLIANDNQEER